MSENAETIIEIFFRRLEITAYVVLFINIGGTDMSLNEDVLPTFLYIISCGPFHNIFFRKYCSLYTLYVICISNGIFQYSANNWREKLFNYFLLLFFNKLINIYSVEVDYFGKIRFGISTLKIPHVEGIS